MRNEFMTEAEYLKHLDDMEKAREEFAVLWNSQKSFEMPMPSRVWVERLCWLFFIHAKGLRP